MLTPVSFNLASQPAFKGKLEGIDNAQRNIKHLGPLDEDNLFDVLKLTHFMKTAGKPLVKKLPQNDVVQFNFIEKTDKEKDENIFYAVIKHIPGDKSKESKTISWNPKSYKPVNKFIENFIDMAKKAIPENKFDKWNTSYESGTYNDGYIARGLKNLISNM